MLIGLMFCIHHLILDIRWNSLMVGKVKCENHSSPIVYITYKPNGGFGNLMFEYASTYSLSRRFNLTLLLHDNDLERVFDSSLRGVRYDDKLNKNFFTMFSRETRSNVPRNANTIGKVRWIDVYETFGSAFDVGLVGEIDALVKHGAALYGCGERLGVRVNGYLQSYRYFDAYLDEIREQFTFSDSQIELAHLLVEAARRFDKSTFTELEKRSFQWNRLEGSGFTRSVESLTLSPPTYVRDVAVVGVHIRRGDIIQDMNLVSAGYQTGDYHYLLNATRFIRSFYAARSQKVRFLVSSNDLAWARTFFPFRRDAIFIGANTPGGDYFAQSGASTVKNFLVLAHCDALVITVGSYGFWAATLGNIRRPIVYYSRPFRRGSFIESQHNYSIRDYYPPNWTGLSGE